MIYHIIFSLLIYAMTISSSGWILNFVLGWACTHTQISMMLIYVLYMTRTKKTRRRRATREIVNGIVEMNATITQKEEEKKIFVIPVKMLLYFWAIPLSPFAFVYLCLYGIVDSFFFARSAWAHFPVFLRMLSFSVIFLCSMAKRKLLYYKCFSYMIFCPFPGISRFGNI